jgi:hypothetical protein
MSEAGSGKSNGLVSRVKWVAQKPRCMALEPRTGRHRHPYLQAGLHMAQAIRLTDRGLLLVGVVLDSEGNSRMMRRVQKT